MIGTLSLRMIILPCPCLTWAAQTFSDAEIPYYDVSIIVTGAAETVWLILAVMSQRRKKKILAWKSLARINTSFKKCNFKEKLLAFFNEQFCNFYQNGLLLVLPWLISGSAPEHLWLCKFVATGGRVFTTPFHWQIDCTGSISCQFSG